MNKNKYGDITESGLLKGLDNYLGNGQAKVTDHGNGLFLVVFPSGRAYEVDSDGNGTYLGTEEDLLTKVVITADKESNSTPVLVQEVKVSVRTYIPVEDENITLIYAWSKSEDECPVEEDFVMADLSGTKLNRTATVYSNVTDGGDYYLWVKAIINDTKNPKSFGEYAIKEFTTLRSCADEGSSTSSFLGNSNLKRNVIKSVTLSSSLQGHQAGVGNCWDVSESQKGSILGWYTESVVDDVTYYNVTIGSDGGVVANVNSNNLFSYIGYGVSGEVTITGLENLDTSLVKNMSYMFGNCTKLTSLNISNFNTANVTNMYFMFGNCTKLTSLNLSSFDTSNVTNMYYMFGGCSGFTNLDVSNFNTSNVTDISFIFHGCSGLTCLDVSNFNTSNVTSMTNMFSGCSRLTNLDVSNFDTSNVTSMTNMFAYCSELTNIDLSNFNTSNVTSMSFIFSGCSGLTSLDLSNFNTANVTNMSFMFSGCKKLLILNISHFDTTNVTNLSYMFNNCTSLTSLDLRNLDYSKVTDYTSIFNNVPNATIIYVSTEEMKEWVLDKNSSFTNIQVVT